MRCLTLADALQQQGAECVFVCRAHEGHMVETVRQKGHAVRVLAFSSGEMRHSDKPDHSLLHAHWLGDTSESDALNTQHALRDEGVIDWLVVDHYALDVKWEQSMRLICHNLMVIDDLVDREHDCDLLLDQNLGRTEQHYKLLVPTHTKLLVGPDFSLLRPEFATCRSESLSRREQPTLKRLLLSMGGIDKDNLTGRVLDALNQCVMPFDTHITVVMGQHAPWLTAVQAQAAGMSYPTEVLINVQNMAELMMRSDLAIGAAGGTAWERCSLGLPTCAFVVADNQRAGAIALKNEGAVCLMQEFTEIIPYLHELFQTETLPRLQQMSHAAAAVTDGQGAKRVSSYLMEVAYG